MAQMGSLLRSYRLESKYWLQWGSRVELTSYSKLIWVARGIEFLVLVVMWPSASRDHCSSWIVHRMTICFFLKASRLCLALYHTFWGKGNTWLGQAHPVQSLFWWTPQWLIRYLVMGVIFCYIHRTCPHSRGGDYTGCLPRSRSLGGHLRILFTLSCFIPIAVLNSVFFLFHYSVPSFISDGNYSFLKHFLLFTVLCLFPQRFIYLFLFFLKYRRLASNT